MTFLLTCKGCSVVWKSLENYTTKVTKVNYQWLNNFCGAAVFKKFNKQSSVAPSWKYRPRQKQYQLNFEIKKCFVISFWNVMVFDYNVMLIVLHSFL